MNEADSGVGACDAGVDPGVPDSYHPRSQSVKDFNHTSRGGFAVKAHVVIIRPVGDGRPGEDPILIEGSRLTPLRRRATRRLHVVVEARDDVAARCALEVGALLLCDAVFDLGLLAKKKVNPSAQSSKNL